MMNNNRIIMIDGSKSGWFEKAIFILKDKDLNKNIRVNMVKEAEDIVECYLKQNYNNKSSDYKVVNKMKVYPKKNKITIALNIILVISIFLLIYNIVNLIAT